MNFAKFLTVTFLQNTSGGYFWNMNIWVTGILNQLFLSKHWQFLYGHVVALSTQYFHLKKSSPVF